MKHGSDVSQPNWILPTMYLAVQVMFVGVGIAMITSSPIEPIHVAGLVVVWAAVDIIIVSSYAVLKIAKWS